MMRWRAAVLLLLAISAGLTAFTACAGSSPVTAERLITRLYEVRRFHGLRGSARLIRTDTRTGEKEIRRLAVKMRRSGPLTTVLYQAGKSKTAAAQALVLKLQHGRSPSGFLLKSSEQAIALCAAMMEEPFLGSDLKIGDLTEDFLCWPTQRLGGEEVVLRRRCRILESEPPSGSSSSTAMVRSWVSPELGLLLKVEKYDLQGKLLRCLKAERVTRLEGQGWVVAKLSVAPGSGTLHTTVLEGTRYDGGAEIPASEFEVEHLRRSLKSSASRSESASLGGSR